MENITERLESLGIKVLGNWKINAPRHTTFYYIFKIKDIEWCISECLHKNGKNTYCLSNEKDPFDIKYEGFSKDKCFSVIEKELGLGAQYGEIKRYSSSI